ncbi:MULTISPECIES: hypothetical protein [Dolichospermum]|uniref:Heterocycloanthracin/sonorensin family bacteriocin n=1 Tax=Dolichospermum heterosporum TAC447 TaxID=747523 RepID=A0ABY5LWE0_9CYAN|nr:MULTISPECIES: hypothetical protein [Dolichospermum]MBE9258749.1 hypothetical protein [Dolichospermum sp. LEGE 00246]UUO15077.1 hypothetical protein NG743_24235 [Dolichospermum heterosporum TAC447]
MLAEKTLSQPTIEMRLVDQADKLERLLLSEEEIATLEKLAMSGVFDSETTQRWFANCGGCVGCGGCRGCRGCGCRGCGCRGCGGCGGCGGCRPCGGCGGCGHTTVSGVLEDTDEVGFGY